MTTGIKGRICERHPELEGARYAASGACKGCNKEHTQKQRAAKKLPRGMKVQGKVCQHHPELEGLRYAASRTCVACNGRPKS